MQTKTWTAVAILVAACVAGQARADIIIFDDVLHEGAALRQEGGTTVAFSSPGDPVYSGDVSISIEKGAWAQAGLEGFGSGSSEFSILELKYYRQSGGGNFIIRDFGWGEYHLTGGQAEYFTVDGDPGYANNTLDQWLTLRVDVGKLIADGEISGVNALNVGGGAVAHWFFDDVRYTVPEPASLALLGLGGLAMLRRRVRV